MKKLFARIKVALVKFYKKIHKLPKWSKYAIGVILILVGAINIVNPLLNGVFIILLGLGLLSEEFFQKLKNKFSRHKKPQK